MMDLSDIEPHDPFGKLAPFEQVGRYRLHRKLSEGGMGQVWLAHARHAHGDIEDNLAPYPVAIKFARLSKVLDQSVKEGMLTEGGIMSKLNWGMTPTVHEIGECDGLSYVAMEYIEGVPLSDFNEAVTRRGMRIPFDGVATIAYDAARTLDYLHNVDWGGERQNLVHCDITDRNFMVSGHGRLVCYRPGRMSSGALDPVTQRDRIDRSERAKPITERVDFSTCKRS